MRCLLCLALYAQHTRTHTQHTYTRTYAPQALPRSIRNRNAKFDANVHKRGNVPPGKIAERQEDGPKLSPTLIIFFLVIVVGSSLVPLLNLFGVRSGKPPAE